MHTFEITLLVDGIHPEDSDKLDALLEISEDAQLSYSDGQTRLITVLAGQSIIAAVSDFVAAVKAAVPGFVAHKAELQLVNVSDIAQAVGLNRESVRLWTVGKRGPGGFPMPLSAVADGRMRIWTLSSVEAWLHQTGLQQIDTRSLSIEEVCAVNHYLECLQIAGTAPQFEWKSSGRRAAVVDVSSAA